MCTTHQITDICVIILQYLKKKTFSIPYQIHFFPVQSIETNGFFFVPFSTSTIMSKIEVYAFLFTFIKKKENLNL